MKIGTIDYNLKTRIRPLISYDENHFDFHK